MIRYRLDISLPKKYNPNTIRYLLVLDISYASLIHRLLASDVFFCIYWLAQMQHYSTLKLDRSLKYAMIKTRLDISLPRTTNPYTILRLLMIDISYASFIHRFLASDVF